MEFRRAEDRDIAALAAMKQQQLVDEGDQPGEHIDAPLREYFETALHDGSLVVWIAEDNGELIATGAICFYRLPPTYLNPSGLVGHVTNMYTQPAFRRQGIAREILNRVMGEARARKCRVVRLHASRFGRTLYESAGFVDAEDFLEYHV